MSIEGACKRVKVGVKRNLKGFRRVKTHSLLWGCPTMAATRHLEHHVKCILHICSFQAGWAVLTVNQLFT